MSPEFTFAGDNVSPVTRIQSVAGPTTSGNDEH